MTTSTSSHNPMSKGVSFSLSVNIKWKFKTLMYKEAATGISKGHSKEKNTIFHDSLHVCVCEKPGINIFHFVENFSRL